MIFNETCRFLLYNAIYNRLENPQTIMLKRIKAFLLKNRSKKFILFAFGFIIITLFAYFPNSWVMTAFERYNQNVWAWSDYSHQSLASLDKNVRDFKIPSSQEELFPGGDPKSSAIPWVGSKLVVIDAGHGGADPGTSSRKHSEKEISLEVSLRLNEILKEKGVETYMTRTDDSWVDLLKRIQIANEKKAAMFISIHCNWFTDSSLRGAMTLYYPSETLSSGGLFEKDYAGIMRSELAGIPGTKDLGMADRPNLAVLHHAEMPSVLVELGFLSNPSDESLLSSPQYQDKYAQALADGILKSLDKINSR